MDWLIKPHAESSETKTHVTVFPVSMKALVELRKTVSKIKLILLHHSCLLWAIFFDVWSKCSDNCEITRPSRDGAGTGTQWVHGLLYLVFLIKTCPPLCVCVCVSARSYPVDRRVSVFSPTRKLWRPTPPPSLLSPALACLPYFPRPPRTLCGLGCVRSGRPIPKGDWAPRCTPRSPSGWLHLGCWTCQAGSCWTAEKEEK